MSDDLATRPIDPQGHARDLIDLVAASPSSYHAAAAGAARLEAAGFVRQDEAEPWDATPGGHVLVRDGALMAWWVPAGASASGGFRIIGSHTDSPTFKLKPEPLLVQSGYSQIGVEVYGGPLLNSWLDRELGVAGRIVTADGAEHLVSTDPVARIPQLAIHLDRQVNEGLTLDRQRHTAPLLDLVAGTSALELVAARAGVLPRQVVGHDLVCFVTQSGAVFGDLDQFLASSRLDNLSSVHASLVALERLAAQAPADGPIAVLAAFDHEELGSSSRSGACGPILEDVLTRTVTALGGGAEELAVALHRSSVVSSDAGHAVHPNYPERHDPVNRPVLGGGPLLKINANQRYATDAVGSGIWARACAEAGVRFQPFVSNNQVPCGSTIGPLTATRLGIRTVDVGTPLLSMHSARELASVSDLADLAAALRAYLAGA